ncbi:hypothetical protein BCR35DRAFT_312026 [Leucosporidium creatinivorum]|uniref:Pentatricopeptide repeat domain-containing protein n=1 Tax=Leucosporidium creatinivorum TaxID=106004 RepID=A0A1Y2G300_9BASI|nr:hypothetical protein BCR35DRAFT_312026 [Leucosporidium creatinivorum]
MITQTPHLTLPTPSTTSAGPIPSRELLPEKWIWRLPATTAINSILRTLNDPACSDRTRDALLPLAVTLANHALHWDSLIWAAVLFSRGHSHSMPWERLLARVRGQTGGKGLEEEVAVMTRLDKRERMPGRNERLVRWEWMVEEKQRQRWELETAKGQARRVAVDGEVIWANGRRAQARRRQAKEPLSDRLLRNRVAHDESALKSIKPSTAPTPLPPTIHPLSSLPQPTIDLLFLFLAQHPERTEPLTSTALALSLGRIDLSLPVSRRTLVHSINMSLDNDRPDLASRLWVAMLQAVQRDRAGARQLMRLFNKIKHKLRDSGKRYRSVMDRPTLASVATMARALDREWVRVKAEQEALGGRGGDKAPSSLNEMIDLLVTFPFAPFVRDFEAGSERRRVAFIHNKVDKMTRKVFRGIIEEVIDRPIYLGPLKVVVGNSPSSLPNADARPPRLPLNAISFNLLITYALRQFNSSEIALRLVEKMRQQGIEPNAATHNILLELLAQSSKDALDLVGANPRNSHTFPSLIKYLSSVGDWEHIEKIVYFLLPELDLRQSSPSSSSDTPAPSLSSLPTPTAFDEIDPSTKTSSDIPASLPPPPGRSPWLYVALLSALVSAGRTGLAERVFRSARWAAEISRRPPQAQFELPDLSSPPTPAPPPPATGPAQKPWTLPPQAFILMLQLYAKEARRGKALIAQGPDSEPSTFVLGWGRHALRVFLLSERRASLRARLGEAVDITRSTRMRRIDAIGAVEPFLRAEAAPIVATWELEGGSRGPELESLSKAMMSPEAREALGVLFPERRVEGEEKEEGERWSEWARRGSRRASEERTRTRREGLRSRERARRVNEEQ